MILSNYWVSAWSSYVLFKLRLCVAVVIKLSLVNILDQQIKHDGFEEINRNKSVITES